MIKKMLMGGVGVKNFFTKLNETVEFETLWSGILGIIAVIATLIEMILCGVDAVSVAAAIKDIAGTLAVIMVLCLAIKHLVHKEPKNFDDVFTAEMDIVSSKYAPLLQRQGDSKHRYFMASKLSAINDNSPGAYHKLFDFVKEDEVEISISKTVFVGVGGDDALFKAIKGKIVANIAKKCENFSIIEKCESSTSGVRIFFKEKLTTASHAKQLADIIDCVLLSFIAEYKRT